MYSYSARQDTARSPEVVEELVLGKIDLMLSFDKYEATLTSMLMIARAFPFALWGRPLGRSPMLA